MYSDYQSILMKKGYKDFKSSSCMRSSVRQLKIWKFRLKQMDTDINYNVSVQYEIPSNCPWSSKHTNNHHDITISSGDQYIRLIGLLAGSYPLWKVKKKLSVNHCTQTIEKKYVYTLISSSTSYSGFDFLTVKNHTSKRSVIWRTRIKIARICNISFTSKNGT